MTQAESASTTTLRFVETPEYRRLVYKMFRGEVRLPHPGGRIAKWPASKAWRHAKQYVDAVR